MELARTPWETCRGLPRIPDGELVVGAVEQTTEHDFVQLALGPTEPVSVTLLPLTYKPKLGDQFILLGANLEQMISITVDRLDVVPDEGGGDGPGCHADDDVDDG